jgi:hypothetical protein
MKNGTAATKVCLAFCIFNFEFLIGPIGRAAADDLPDAVDCAADARLLNSHFSRYGSTQRIGPDGAGVRIYLPAIAQSIGQTGLYSYFSLAGDFEVSVNYELLNISPPKGGYGATCGITVDTQGPGGSIGITRGETVGKPSGYVVTRGQPESGGETKYESTYHPSAAKAGRMVLRREKADVVCLAADTPQGELKELCRVPFSPATVRQVRMFADNGGSHTTVDVRLTNLEVRAREIAGGLPKYQPPRPWGWWWWAGGGLIALAAAALVTIWFRSGRWPWSGGGE